jgi:hypothetical protein
MCMPAQSSVDPWGLTILNFLTVPVGWFIKPYLLD